jgi:enamine deaminase RidA (YjgF/YER057c/UK114 family)
MRRRTISSGAPWEELYGYSRAVVAGDTVYVSGTAPVMAEGAEPPSDAYGHARRCL